MTEERKIAVDLNKLLAEIRERLENKKLKGSMEMFVVYDTALDDAIDAIDEVFSKYLETK